MSIFFTGSYTQMLSPEMIGVGDGISTIQLNDTTGELKVLHTMKTVNPSYLTISDDNKYLYCNTELSVGESPKVQAYQIKDDYSLKFLNEQFISGGYPCHIQEFDANVFVSCYETGNILQFPLDSNGKLLECTINHQHRGSSINKDRQEGPHAHQVVVHPDKRQLFACDLGIDTIKVYDYQRGRSVAAPTCDINIIQGSGSRHMVFNKHGNLGYVLNELTGTVSLLKDQGSGFEQVGTYNSLPANYTGTPSASAIRIHPGGLFLYAGNRTFDAITIFEIDGERLTVLDYHFTKGKELREFNITPDGKWLIACHQDSHDTVVYQITNDGKLIEKFRTKNIKTPVCISFLKSEFI